MTNEEAKALFEEDLKDGKYSNDCPECNARKKAISALEKQIPKKKKKRNECPECGYSYAFEEFCPYCGQALDWSDDE